MLGDIGSSLVGLAGSTAGSMLGGDGGDYASDPDYVSPEE